MRATKQTIQSSLGEYWKAFSARSLRSKLFIAIVVIGVAGLFTGIIVVGRSYNREYWLSRFGFGSRVVFKIENRVYRQSELDKMAELPLANGQTKTVVIKQIYDDSMNKQAANGMGIKFTQAEINKIRKYTNTLNANGKEVNEWADLVAFNHLLNAYLEENKEGLYKGYSLIFRFGEHIERGPDFIPSGYGDPKLIAIDRAYAKEKADYYHQQLKDKKLTAGEVLALLKKDPKLGYLNLTNTNRSVQFGNSAVKPWDQEVSFDEVKNYVKQQSSPGLSEVMIGKTVPDFLRNKDSVESFFYIVQLDQIVIKGSQRETLQGITSKIKSRYYGL